MEWLSFLRLSLFFEWCISIVTVFVDGGFVLKLSKGVLLYSFGEF